MAANDVLSFDGTSLTSGAMQAYWDARDPIEVTNTIETVTDGPRPRVTRVTIDGIARILRVNRRSGTTADFVDAVEALFNLEDNQDGARTLTWTHEDGTTTLRYACYIAARRRVTENPFGEYHIEIFVPGGVAENDNPTTSGNNPANVTNNGRAAVPATITLTTTGHVTHRACTVADTSGNGLERWPVVFALNDTAATTTNTLVYINGKLVDSFVDNSGAADSRVFALIDAAADGSTTAVDIFYGTGLTHPNPQALDENGQDWTASSNTQWSWRSSDWNVESYQTRPGVWKPAKTGNHATAAGATYAITTSGSTAVISLGAAGTYPDDGYDSLVIDLGGARAGTTSAFTIRRITANLDGTNARAFIRYKIAGSEIWRDTSYVVRTNATTTTAVDLDNAIMIAIGLENDQAVADPATLTIGGGTGTLDLIGTPTVVVGAAANYDRYDGTYTIGSYVLTFNDLLVPDGTLTIDSSAKTITSSVAGAFFWLGDSMIAYSHPDVWALVATGTITVTDGLTATDVVSFREVY